MTYNACPHHLVPLSNQIVDAFNIAQNLPNTSDQFRSGYFACLLAQIMLEFDQLQEDLTT